MCYYTIYIQCLQYIANFIYFILLLTDISNIFTEDYDIYKCNPNFTFSEPCIVIDICKKDQQIAHFS